jgi:hypothetical protein
MRARGKWVALVVAACSISTGVAIAGGESSKTSPVEGDFQATLVKTESRKCDKKHVRLEQRFKGTQTSSDPRLAGDLKIDAKSVVSTKNGWGRSEGKVEIRPNGAYKFGGFRGKFIAVVGPGGNIEGFVTGRTTGPGSVYLFANFNAQQNGKTLTGEFGKDSQVPKPYGMPGDEDPAVVTNACFKKHGHGHGHGHGH